MSRYTSKVPLEACRKVFGSIPKNAILHPVVSPFSIAAVLDATGKYTENAYVLVAHGFDRPINSYFIDIMPDCSKGIYYGGIGLTTKVTRAEMLAAYHLLGIKAGEDAVALDLPY